MVTLTIDGIKTQVPEGTTILEAARTIGIKIPTLCFLRELNEVGACRVCVVEVEGSAKLNAACNTVVSEGMVVRTNSPRARNARRVNLQLILSQHNCICPTCVRSGNCTLQKLANDLNIYTQPYETKLVKRIPIDRTFPLHRENDKCIKCMRCVNVCDKMQSLGVWEINGTGSHLSIRTRGNSNIRDLNCSLCGQCITHCPVGALRARDDTERVFRAFEDDDKITVIQIAPAVRAAWGEGIGLPKALATEKRMASAFKALGADYVFDTSFTADLTIMEEGSEFVERLNDGKEHKYPLFTSCCPGWVRFVKSEYPELVGELSSAKSPQAMFGAVAKNVFAKKLGVDPSKIFCVSVMPCVAKKYEADVEELKTSVGRDVDAVITTREFDRMLRAARINVADLPESEFDFPFGEKSGAGILFGATGGVMEAALRTSYYLITGENCKPDTFKDVRAKKENIGIREREVTINGRTVRLAVVSGLGNARELIEDILSGEKKFDFVEIMACPGGCTGGGGQPIADGEELAVTRGKELYKLGEVNEHCFSHENPEIIKLYEEYLGKPLSEKSHELLHTDVSKWNK